MKIKVIYLARLSEDIGKKEEYIDLGQLKAKGIDFQKNLI